MKNLTSLIVIVLIFSGCSLVKSHRSTDLFKDDNSCHRVNSNIGQLNNSDITGDSVANNYKPSGLNNERNVNDLSSKIYVYNSDNLIASTYTTSDRKENYKVNDHELRGKVITVILMEDTIPIVDEDEKLILKEAKNSFTFGIIALATTLIGLGVPLGIIFSILAITNGNEARKIIEKNPDQYSNAKNAETGIWFGYASIVLTILQYIAVFFLLLLLIDVL